MTYSSEVLADSPIAWYRLGEASGTTMTDSSGNSRSGTYANVTLAATGLLAGDSDTAASFNGTASKGTVNNASWMDVGTAFTVEAWISTSATGFREIAAQYNTSSVRAWEFRIDSTTGALNFIKLAGGTTSSIGSGSIRDGAKHHCVATYDGANIRLYVDGVLNQTTASTGSISGTLADLHIGVRSIDQWFSGTIDEVALYGTVLSGTRIAAHYTAGIINGTLAATLANTTLAASGTVTSSITGTLAATLADTTLAAAGSETISGTLGTTLGNTTLAASGTESLTGTLAATLADTALAASGVVAISITGTLAATLDATNLVGSGVETVVGPLATTLAGATLAASGSVAIPVTGTLAVTLANTTLAATGTDFIVEPTPTSRTYTILAEARALVLAAETRRTTINAETRTLSIAAEPRTRTIAAEPRTLEVTT
jgi:hypothetical protein